VHGFQYLLVHRLEFYHVVAPEPNLAGWAAAAQVAEGKARGHL